MSQYIAPHYLYTFTFVNIEISLLAQSQIAAINEVNSIIDDQRWLRLHKSPERFIMGV